MKKIQDWIGTYLSWAPSENLGQIVLVPKLSKFRPISKDLLVIGGEVAQSFESRVGERHATKLVRLVDRLRGCRAWCRHCDILRQSQRCLQVHNALSEECQSIVEAPAPLVETLMCHCQPLGLIGEDLVATIAQQSDIEPIQQLRVCVDVVDRALGVKV